jgi:hypothetical protein
MMASLLRSAVLAACLGACCAGPALAAAPSQLFTWDPAELALARQKLVARDPLYLPSYQNLLKDADAARIGHFTHDVTALAPARYFSGEKKYADKAGELARA